MTHDPGLNDVFARSRKRRKEESVDYNPFCFVVAGEPGTMNDIPPAIVAIEEERKVRSEGGARREVTISPDIRGEVSTALAVRHSRQFTRPGRHIIARIIVDSVRRHAPVPEMPDSTASVSIASPIDDGDAAERAAARLAQLRGL